MICDTCIYNNCDDVQCGDCKFLRYVRNVDDEPFEACFCHRENHFQGKQFDMHGNVISCRYYKHRVELFKCDEMSQ